MGVDRGISPDADQPADHDIDDPDRHAHEGIDQSVGGGQDRTVLLADREQRVAEYGKYQAIVEAARAWSEAVPELKDAWEKIKVKYGYQERFVSAAQPPDGSWRGDGGRKLDSAQNREVDAGYPDRIVARIRDLAESGA